MHPSPSLANHSALAERIAEREDQALDRMVEAIFCGTDADEPVPFQERVDASDDQQREQAVHQNDEGNWNVPEDLAGNLLVHLALHQDGAAGSSRRTGCEGACADT